MPQLKNFMFGCLVSLAYALKYELIDKKTLLWVSIGGGISWLTYKLTFMAYPHSEISAYFLASLLMSIYAETMARILKKPVTIFLIVAMLPVVPGQGIFDTMSLFVQKQSEAAINMGLKTLAIAGALTLGNLTASTAASFLNRKNVSRFKFSHLKK